MQTFVIDPSHTDVSFAAKHMMVTTVRGKFGAVEGSLEIDPDAPERSGGEIRVVVASLSTGFEARDQHLRSADFFDAENHPTIVFRATTIRARRDDQYDVSGDMTIRDVTRPVTFQVELLGFYNGMTGARRIGLSARTKINRKEWGLNWNVALEAGGWLVGDEVRLEIDVAAEEAATVAAGATEAGVTVDVAERSAA
ncbi:MAG: YceI family protein [Chloroflexi bacterium]|nr:YceI family protein [Chloroflexota bacterium]